MILLPIHHFGSRVGSAMVDDTFVSLTSEIKWKVELPDRFRRAMSSDVEIAMLREDEIFRHSCHVVSLLKVGSTNRLIRLARVALRPELIPLLNEYHDLPRGHSDRPLIASKIHSIHFSVSRVIFISPNLSDCRSENLREVSLDSTSLSPL